ncbi:protein of unknown function UPF0102 [Chloroherpeton thalassium ATCC 35110]|uniref:UPF0102 protein Ctha_1382 n=1 Tax=Chloroherpeton thalassium (strain ATCC 35110 / GB-78) TaxID=517418 RepID=Y1382_CHLT3|nr:YraN family protein [Chloroherpeton thalassium]B3QZF2.1 RecName: Full=UPF0102 protein Ctha_1382 [Chloroherpeton thalassium ATCC 35110]ACF13845.1 protein of unknown function UPF0102 [Chloroherpeton thalassium ATCC 35110]
MNTNVAFGKKGEDMASAFLKKCGYQILRRNYRSGNNEIDLITKKDNIVAFVEVKTRHNLNYGHPAEAVTLSKQKELIKAAQNFINDNPSQGVDYRFDVVAIILDESKRNAFNEPCEDIFFIEDAFRTLP